MLSISFLFTVCCLCLIIYLVIFQYFLSISSYKLSDFIGCIAINIGHYKLHRYPTFFDDIAARLLPIIPLIVYRLIENDAIDLADRVLAMYSAFLAYHPLRFTFVRDILAYFYGHLPGKLIVRILNVLDLSKVTTLFMLWFYFLVSCFFFE